jgi:hypothetical protein
MQYMTHFLAELMRRHIYRVDVVYSAEGAIKSVALKIGASEASHFVNSALLALAVRIWAGLHRGAAASHRLVVVQATTALFVMSTLAGCATNAVQTASMASVGFPATVSASVATERDATVAYLKRYAEKDTVAVVVREFTQGARVVGLGEEHVDLTHKELAQKVIQAMHGKGLTHFALEVDERNQAVLERFSETGDVSLLTKDVLYPGADINPAAIEAKRRLIVTAKAEGLALVAVDPRTSHSGGVGSGDAKGYVVNQAGQQVIVDEGIANNIMAVLNADPKNKVLFYAGNEHVEAGERQYASAMAFVRSERTWSAGAFLRKALGRHARLVVQVRDDWRLPNLLTDGFRVSGLSNVAYAVPVRPGAPFWQAYWMAIDQDEPPTHYFFGVDVVIHYPSDRGWLLTTPEIFGVHQMSSQLDYLKEYLRVTPENSLSHFNWEDLGHLQVYFNPQEAFRTLRMLDTRSDKSEDTYLFEKVNIVTGWLLDNGGYSFLISFLRRQLEMNHGLSEKERLMVQKSLQDAYLRTGQYAEAAGLKVQGESGEAVRRTYDALQAQKHSGTPIGGVGDMARFARTRNVPARIYVNPAILTYFSVPAASVNDNLNRPFAHAIRTKDTAYFQQWFNRVNLALRFLSNGEFDLDLKAVTFDPLTSPTGSLESEVEIFNSKELGPHMDKAFSILIGYELGGPFRGSYLGRGVLIVDPTRIMDGVSQSPGEEVPFEFPGSVGVHEILHGLGMMHMRANFPRQLRPLFSCWKWYRWEDNGIEGLGRFLHVSEPNRWRLGWRPTPIIEFPDEWNKVDVDQNGRPLPPRTLREILGEFALPGLLEPVTLPPVFIQ